MPLVSVIGVFYPFVVEAFIMIVLTLFVCNNGGAFIHFGDMSSQEYIMILGCNSGIGLCIFCGAVFVVILYYIVFIVVQYCV